MELLTLFFSGFTSSTLLPGSSEALFAWMLSQQSWPVWLLIVVVGTANSLGGMTNWLLGILIRRGLLEDRDKKKHNRKVNKTRLNAQQWLEQHGAPVLFFSFLPIIGDPLCLVAGLIKISWLQALLYISLGKFFRYIIIAYFIN